MSAATSALAAVVREAFSATLAELAPARRVHDALPPRPPKGARVCVVAAGKAAVAMTEGALARWPTEPMTALVVTTDGTDAGSLARDPRVTLLRAAHPLPDARSVTAAEDALRRARELGPRDLLLCLVSGGASALLSAPPEGLSLQEKSRLVGALFDAGASIRDVNTVRRHLSRIKGGHLALAAAPARTLTLAWSDVVGGTLHDIGSGPGSPDPTSVEDAAAILRRVLPDEAARASLHLTPSLQLEPGAPRTRGSILCDPDQAADTLARLLARAGLSARTAPAEEGDASEMATRRAQLAQQLAPGEAVVIPCEPTVRLGPVHGRGGRAGRVALLVMEALPDDVVFLAGATDGVDGSSGHGGALVHADAARRAGHEAIQQALARYDDAPLHDALGSALPGRPTGQNLTDLHVLARAPREMLYS